MQASSIPTHWLLIEAFGVACSFAMYHLLALRKREGWLLYIISGIAIAYLMAMKGSWVTVINQCMMMVLGGKNYVIFGKPQQPLYASWLDWLCLPVYLASCLWVKEWNLASLTEVVMWGVIIIKTLTLGKGQLNGWVWQMLQQALSMLFGWQREIYIYVLKSAFQFIQAIWGYWKWKNP